MKKELIKEILSNDTIMNELKKVYDKHEQKAVNNTVRWRANGG